MEFIYSFWQVSLEAAPYLLLGFLFAGIIKAFLKDEFISKHLGKNNLSSVLKSSLLGIPLPLCSCGVIPAAVSLRKQGASKAATSSFLISTPESGIDSIALTYGLLGPVFAIIRPIAAFFSAVIAGILESFFPEKKETIIPEPMSCCSTKTTDLVAEDNCCSTDSVKHKESLYKKVKSGLFYSFHNLMNDISFHLFIGLLLAAAISYFVPESFFLNYLSDDILSLFIMIAIGIPMYICASASTPVAAALILKGLSPGAALVFLMAGPATNLASITVLQKSLGKATVFRNLTVIIISSLIFGYLCNILFYTFNIDLKATVLENKHDETVGLLSIFSAIIMYLLIIKGIWYEKLKGLFVKNSDAQVDHALHH
jgi:uncharacterized protein